MMKRNHVRHIFFRLIILIYIVALQEGSAHATASLPERIVNGDGPIFDSEKLKLTVLHTNDTHAHLENIPRRFTAIHKIRNSKENTLLLDGGDVFSGVPFFNRFLGQADVKFMNEIQYDAITLGNHEFDRTPEILRNFIHAAEFPIVSANVDFSRNDTLQGLAVNEIGTPGNPGLVYPAIIKEKDGQKIGILGLTTERTPIISKPSKNIVFNNATKKAKETVGMLESRGVNKIIVISHLGYKKDRELAKNVKGIDIIVGSHSHTKLRKPVVYHKEKDPTLVVQAGKHGKYLGKLDVTFDETGKLIKWKGKLINIMKKDQKGNYLYAEDEWAKKYLNELKMLK